MARKKKNTEIKVKDRIKTFMHPEDQEKVTKRFAEYYEQNRDYQLNKKEDKIMHGKPIKMRTDRFCENSFEYEKLFFSRLWEEAEEEMKKEEEKA